MRFVADDVELDLVDVSERANDWENVREGMKIGLINADNITFFDRTAVRRFFAQLPIVRPVPRQDVREPLTAKVIGIANLVEGRDWAFATSRDGTFGVFFLDEPSLHFVEGATFHLWPGDSSPDHQNANRVDFLDLGDYQTEELDAMQWAA